MCTGTIKIIKTPNKLFIHVPKNGEIQRTWLQLARLDPKSVNTDSRMYFCEDHFDLSIDMEHNTQNQMTGSLPQVCMKSGCIPTRFKCQSDEIRRQHTSTTVKRPKKEQRKKFIKECEYLEKSSTATKKFEHGETSPGSAVHNTFVSLKLEPAESLAADRDPLEQLVEVKREISISPVQLQLADSAFSQGPTRETKRKADLQQIKDISAGEETPRKKKKPTVGRKPTTKDNQTLNIKPEKKNKNTTKNLVNFIETPDPLLVERLKKNKQNSKTPVKPIKPKEVPATKGKRKNKRENTTKKIQAKSKTKLKREEKKPIQPAPSTSSGQMSDEINLDDIMDDGDPGSDVEFTPIELEDIERDEGVVYSSSLHVPRHVWLTADEQMEDIHYSQIAEELNDDDDAEDQLLTSNDKSFDWMSNFEKFNGRREMFKGPSGPQETSEHQLTPYDTFTAIWDLNIVTRIAMETNVYARHRIWRSNKPDRKWKDTDASEIYLLFGLYVSFGWKMECDKLYFDGTILQVPILKNFMDFKRFKSLIKMLHFVNNCTLSKLTGEDLKVAKLKPIVEHCSRKFEALYIPYQNISIDESMPLYTGQNVYDYLRAKSTGFGKRIYECSDLLTGYVWRIMLNTGRKKKEFEVKANDSFGANIVFKLTEGIRNRGHTLYIDNCLNSPALARTLKLSGTDVVGTVRGARRHMPQEVLKFEEVMDDLAKGERLSRHCGDLSVNSWVDILVSRYYCDSAKVVNVLSTFHDESPLTAKVRPDALRFYEDSIKRTEDRDKTLEEVRLENDINLKWYMQAFTRILNVSLWNAFILHRLKKNNDSKTMTFSKFKSVLFANILDVHISDKLKTEQTNKVRLSQGSHFPYPVQKLNDEGKVNPDGLWKCARCKKLADFACVKCEVSLCMGICFEEYHTLEEL